MFDLTELGDDDLRTTLFDALVERLAAKANEDPSIEVVNWMPTAFAVTRRGNLLTLSQGLGVWLLRGDLKWKDCGESPRTFNVGRATMQSKLAITPDRIEGTPDEILDRIVTMFLEWTATGEESLPAVAEPARERRPKPVPPAQENQSPSQSSRQESRPTADVPQIPPPIHTAMQERPAPPGGLTQERPPTAPRTPPPALRTVLDSRPAPVEVTAESPPAPPIADRPTRSSSCASSADLESEDADLANVPGAARDGASGARPGKRVAGSQRVLLNQRGRIRRLYRRSLFQRSRIARDSVLVPVAAARST